MKILFILFLVLIPIKSLSQNNSEINENKWYGSNYIGFATIEIKETSKFNASVFGVAIGKEILNFGSNYKLLAGIDYQRINGNIPNMDDYLTNHNLKIPLNLSYNIFVSENTKIPLQIGVYSSYLFHSIVENVSLNQKNSESGLGFNFGLETFLGFTHFLNETVGFQIGLLSQGDLFQSYKNEFSELQIKNLHALRFGLLLDL